MKSYNAILLDRMKAKNQANQISNIADDLKKLSMKNSKKIISDLSSAWSGASAEKFIGKTEALQQKMVTTANELSAIAAEIEQEAVRVYKREMEAWKLFQSQGGASDGSGGGGTSGHGF